LVVPLSWRNTVRFAYNMHRYRLRPPGPATLNFEGKQDCDGLYNIRGDQHFQTAAICQCGSCSGYNPIAAFAETVVLSRPGDAYDNNKNTDDLDAIADEADPVTNRQFKGG
jgi:hypothetical protein